MNTFVSTLNTSHNVGRTTTANGAATLDTSGSAIVDLFFNAGAGRGKDLSPLFAAAFIENKEWALRALLWARDARNGAGERQLFRNLLQWVEKHSPEDLDKVLPRVADLGRWDDLLVLNEYKYRQKAYALISDALREAEIAKKAQNILDNAHNYSDEELEKAYLQLVK